MNRTICLFANDSQVSQETLKIVAEKLKGNIFHVSTRFTAAAELIICIGGDGSFLYNLRKYDFPEIPFLGINTGNLGFFQEIYPEQVEAFIDDYKCGKYQVQTYKTLEATFEDKGKSVKLHGLNEIVIKGDRSNTAHLDISIGGSFIERFSGDGISVSTPAGSTAYNYALGGSIVDPRIDMIQLTPISPMNTIAYRSFISSLMLPPGLSITVSPEYRRGHAIVVVTDGLENRFHNIDEILICFSEKKVNLIRSENYDFWNKVKSKFL